MLQEQLEAPIRKLRLARAIASDIVHSARIRLSSDVASPSDHLNIALARIVVDAKIELIGVQRDLAVCLANRRQLLKMHHVETTAAGEHAQEAARATQQGEPQLAEHANARADAHLEVAKRAQLAADAIGQQIELLSARMRTAKSALDDARLAVERLRVDELKHGTQERVERQAHRIQRISDILKGISMLQQDLEGVDDE